MSSDITQRKAINLTRTLRGAVRLGEFLNHGFDVELELLGKMILAKSIGMIAGPRGGGKSWLAVLFSYSIAGEKSLDPWGTGIGVTVVYLDGEMRASGLQERLQLLHARNGSAESKEKVERNLYIISRDCIGAPIGFIDTEEGQASIDALIPTSTKIIIIDNLSAWTSGGREDSNSWATIKKWLLYKRLMGVAVLLVHHAGKNGQQRGSSAHEDLLDYSILLSPLPSSPERQDTRFSIEHTKLRDHIPALKQRFEYSIWTENDALNFEAVPIGFDISKHATEMARLRDEGLTCEAIGKKLGVSKSTVSRTLQKLRTLEDEVDEGG